MRKPYRFDELSNKFCVVPGCYTRIKKRLAEQKPTATMCFRHHVESQADRNHTMKQHFGRW